MNINLMVVGERKSNETKMTTVILLSNKVTKKQL